MNSQIQWKSLADSQGTKLPFTDLKVDIYNQIVKITINRPEVHNAFRPLTVNELIDVFTLCQKRNDVRVVILTGAGDKAFCSGGDQKVRGHSGYRDDEGQCHLNVLELQRLIRTLSKPVIAMVNGLAIGGGHVLHVVCDLTLCADHAYFGQTGPRVGSFDGGFGSSYLARIVGQKRAREIWYLCKTYTAKEAFEMGLVNKVVPLSQLEQETVSWALDICQKSPTAIEALKYALNADCDGQTGLQQVAGLATKLYYMTEEAQEGRNAFIQKREAHFDAFHGR